MLNSRNSGSAGLHYDNSTRESGTDSEDDEILEESPCGRWLKRREEVDQRDVPGIDSANLAMDTEEGVEVVWNEIYLSTKIDLKQQEIRIRKVFEDMILLDHENIVKFHRYWTDLKHDKPKVIFITEYLSSGSLKQFLKLTKRKSKRLPLQSWRRWCTQILSALSYMHSCTPPVIHGCLSCDTLFIQHNGLVKIGIVVSDAINIEVKKSKEIINNRHIPPPQHERNLSTAMDVYAFGMCALEMGALEIQQNNDSTSVNEESILRTINSLEDDLQRDLIFKCLKRNPDERPSARDLLFHPLLFEVHSLKLLAAHCLVFSPKNRTQFSETIIDEFMQQYSLPECVLARIPSKAGEEICCRLVDVESADKLEKFVEDVRFGAFPLTAFASKRKPFRSRGVSPATDSNNSASPEPPDIETRRIVNMMCTVKAKDNTRDMAMTLLLRMDDKMNRQLTCQVSEHDTAEELTTELVGFGFVHVEDQAKVCKLLEDTLRGGFGVPKKPNPENSALNKPSSDSEIKSVSSNPKTDDERNWSVADTESPSNHKAGNAASNDHTPSSSGGITPVYSTPRASISQPIEQHLNQDQLDNMPLIQQQEQEQEPEISQPDSNPQTPT